MGKTCIESSNLSDSANSKPKYLMYLGFFIFCSLAMPSQRFEPLQRLRRELGSAQAFAVISG
ncbi:MAG: hypothetical protein ACK4F7_03100 [Inhella sp.]